VLELACVHSAVLSSTAYAGLCRHMCHRHVARCACSHLGRFSESRECSLTAAPAQQHLLPLDVAAKSRVKGCGLEPTVAPRPALHR